MLNKKWMVASLLIGNILLVAIAASSPMYSQAVLQRLLTQTLSSRLTDTNVYPGTITVKGSFSQSPSSGQGNLEHFRQAEEIIAGMPEKFELPLSQSVTQYATNSSQAVSLQNRDDAKKEKSLRLGFLSGLENHITLTAGRECSPELTKDGIMEVLVNERTLIEQDLLLNEVLEFSRLSGKDGSPVRVQVVGVFKNSSADDLYWTTAANSYSDFCFAPEALFRSVIADGDAPTASLNAIWTVMMDYRAMRGDRVSHILSTLAQYRAELKSLLRQDITSTFQALLEAYQPQASKLNITLSVLQVPIFLLLGAFIFMVSQQMLGMEQNEISVLKSRGAKKRHILSVYLEQSLVIGLISLCLGIPLGVLICQLLGASSAFLEFVQRKALSVELSPTSLFFALGAGVISIAAMVLPVFRYANVTIVAHKQRKNRKSGAPWWQKCFLDVILLAVSLYGLYSFENQKQAIAQRVLDGGALDPLLYGSSSLFMLGAGLLGIRLVPMVIRLIFALGKKWWSPALYTSFVRVLRTRGSQGFIMIFLVLTISMGIFNAEAARTINQNAERKIRYSTGADVVVQEEWPNNGGGGSSMAPGGLSTPEELIYYEPDYGKYNDISGVVSHTKVQTVNSASVSTDNGRVNNVQVMGINTKEFGETAWFQESLLPVHWYQYLNAISQNARAVLVSSNFQSTYGYQTGDIITYSNKDGKSIRGIIYGFVDYWPTYAPVVRTKNSDGLYTEKPNYLIVAHFSQLQSAWGVTPYQIWFKMADSSRPLYDFAEQTATKFTLFQDTQAQLTKLKNDPIYQGTNGILTVSFIVVLLLCCTGFLIYWILSIQSRVLQFGIFRAMGMSMREILSMLIAEQIFISGSSIGIGILVGRLTSRFFIPLIQIAYTSADQVLPLEVVSTMADSLRLFGVIAFMIALCMVILGILISRIRISQALKLGED